MFAKQLVSLLVQGKSVIYCDESSWNLWDKPRIRKTWQMAGQPIHRAVNTSRLNNVTIYGAVSNCLPELVFMQWNSSNTEGWGYFLRLLASKLQRQYRRNKPYLVIDNLSSHYAHAIRPLYE